MSLTRFPRGVDWLRGDFRLRRRFKPDVRDGDSVVVVNVAVVNDAVVVVVVVVVVVIIVIVVFVVVVVVVVVIVVVVVTGVSVFRLKKIFPRFFKN